MNAPQTGTYLYTQCSRPHDNVWAIVKENNGKTCMSTVYFPDDGHTSEIAFSEINQWIRDGLIHLFQR